ncbi:unnamed protein product [Coffea canephora]|uniref:Uncharacterized protein n=1 Tax=Coffea canephora TaxID=49390 RepID=A0A068UXJ3_COFCA|nr:unnamed protein product [Coffea canephora]
MDPSALEKEASLEVARESLIAISYSVPDTILSSVVVETLNTGHQVVATNSDGADKFRSKLISISDLRSPDIGIIRCNGHHEISYDHM